MPPRRRTGANPTSENDSDGAGGSDYETGAARGGTAAGAAGGDTSQKDIELVVNKIVRLALFHEYKRRPLPRKDITALIAGKGTFARIFPLVQARLAATFGMQLFELRAKYNENPADQINADLQETQAQAAGGTQTQRRKGKGRAQDDDEDEDEDEDGDEGGDEARKQPARKKVKTGMFVLRNSLPASIVTAMNTRHELPIFHEEEENARGGRNREQDAPPDSGALIPWERADPGSSQEELGIRSVILTLILTGGRTTSEDKLYSLLRRFGLQADTLLPFPPPEGHRDTLSLARYFDLLAKQGYLEKVKVPSPNGGEPTVEWRWGARADAEFGERAALAFMEALCLDPDSSGDSETEGLPVLREANRAPRTAAQKRQHYENKRKRLRRDVEGAAGAPIVGEL